jgi:Flp pilus assembly protein TadD
MSRRIHLALIVILSIIAYSNTFNVPFQFDDEPSIARNIIIREGRFFTDPSRAENLSEFTGLKMRYVTFLTFALNYRLHGLNVAGYHIFNLIIHIINALLLYFLVVLSFRTPLLADSSLKGRSGVIALSAALLFACHPLQTQAVTYIVQRLTSLATMFYLLSVVFYVTWRLKTQDPGCDEGNAGKKQFFSRWKIHSYYLIALISSIIAMKTKEITFTLPAVTALYEFMFFQGPIKKRALALFPFLLTMFIIPISLIHTGKPLEDVISDVSEVTRVQTTMTRWDYLYTEFRVLVTYIRLLFMPVGQNLDYDYPVHHSFLNPEVFVSFLFLVFLFCSGVYLFHRSRLSRNALGLTAFGIFWFFITISVESSIIPIADVIFEHRVYLPSAGFFLAITTALFTGVSTLGGTIRVSKVLPAILALIVIALTAATYARNSVWRDEVTLWEDVVHKSPQKARGIGNLGYANQNRGQFLEAIGLYNRALAIRPTSTIYNNRGMSYYGIGDFAQALQDFTSAIAMNPDYAEPYNNRGVVYSRLGLHAQALEDYTRAVRVKPDFAYAYNNIGNTLKVFGQFDRAIEYYTKAIFFDPRYSGAYLQRGMAYKSLGKADQAMEDLKQSCGLGDVSGCDELRSALNRNTSHP